MSRRTSVCQGNFTFHDFQIKESLGQGRFSQVYHAIELHSKTDVALKIIQKDLIDSDRLLWQLRDEIEVQSRLIHPHICQLYAYFTDEASIYMVLEYCPKGSLAQQLHRGNQTFSSDKISMIALQMAHALAFMHERSVMHRDIKLENVLLDKDYNVKLSDFGWCAHSKEERMTFCGTKEYITPEMLQGRRYGQSVDLYCLGIVLFELFYKKSPFNDNSERRTFHNIERKPLVFPPDSERNIPASARELIALLLQRDPSRRPQAKDLFDHPFMLLHKDKQSEEHTNSRRITRDAMQRFISQSLGKESEYNQPQSEPLPLGQTVKASVQEPLEVVKDEQSDPLLLSSPEDNVQ